jgi:hypothetical protein
MKIHPREENVREARIKLMHFLAELRRELTEGEFLQVVTEELSREWNQVTRYLIREERHPGEPDKPGGLA